jgi:hypothetical protein
MGSKMADANVNNQEVWHIIEQTLNHEVTGTTAVEKTGTAFRLLQQRRRTVAPLDVNLAAAEHYMYMRFLAGKTGDPLLVAAPTGYAIKKIVFFALGKEKDLRTTPNNPVLPPSVESTVWGSLGVEDGLKDYRGANAATGLKPGASIDALKNEAYRNNK